MGRALSLVAAVVIASAGASGTQAKDEPITYFDLGIDVTLLPQDAAGAMKYFTAQAPETQHVLKAACDTFVKHPADAEMPQTVRFCQFILNR